MRAKNINFKSDNSIYKKILIYITVSIVATIIIVSSVLFINFEDITRSIIYNSSKDNLSKISYSSTVMNDSAKTTLLQLYSDPDISKLLLTYSPDAIEFKKAASSLSIYHNIMPYIHSIYIYNGLTNTVYTDLSELPAYQVMDTKNFFDLDIIKLLKKYSSSNNIPPIARQLPVPLPSFNETRTANVFTYILNIQNGNSEKLNSAIILNVSEAWIRKIIETIDSEINNNTFVVDNQNRVVSTVPMFNFLSNISDTNYMKKIISTKSTSNYFIDYIDNTKSLVTFVKSSIDGWYFIQITEYDKIVSKLRSMTIKTISISFFILLIGLFISFVISKRLYSPIKKTFTKLNKLEEDTRKNFYKLKQDFLTNLILRDSDPDIHKLGDLLNNFNIKLVPEGYFVVILIKIDNYSDFQSKYNFDDRWLQKYCIINITSELLSANFVNECADVGDKFISVILNIQDISSSRTTEMIKDTLVSIQENVYKYLDISISFSISSTGETISSINYLYKEALDLSKYLIFHDTKSLIFKDELLLLKNIDYIYPLDKERILINSILYSKFSDSKQLFSEIIQTTNQFTINFYNSTLLRLSIAIMSTIDILEKDKDISLSYRYNNIISELSNFENISQVTEYFSHLFDEIDEKINEKKSIVKSNDVVNKVIELIKKDFLDPNMTIYTISDIVDMSPVYLGRIFKKYTSKSVAEFINELRIEKAKELLETTNKSINDISTYLGFTNSNYFYTLYKKLNGMTPNEFRQTKK